MTTITVTRRRRLDRVRKAARRFVQAVDGLRADDLAGIPLTARSFVSIAATTARKVDAGLTRILSGAGADDRDNRQAGESSPESAPRASTGDFTGGDA